jgi:predicted TIM-barrel fold metal-dependent hydrolase
LHSPVSITDPHIHLWSLSSGWYPHLEGDPTIDRLDDRVGDFSRLVGRDYLLPAYFADVGTWRVNKVVHITACQRPPRWSAETQWLQTLFNEVGHPHGIVGWIDLRQKPSSFEREIEEHLAHPKFRGFRNHEGVDYADLKVQHALRLCGRHDLIYDLVCHEHQLTEAATLARKLPSTRFVLEHTGWPRSGDRETFQIWRDGIRDLASCANVDCKISGLGMTFNHWTVDVVCPWILEVVEAFGAERSMFASNFPVNGLFASFDRLVRAYLEVLSGASANEIDLIFGQTADRAYRL